MRNEDILSPLMAEIAELRRAENTWQEICRALEERGILSSSGQPFVPAALRTYCSNFSRPKEKPLTEQVAELDAALTVERNARLTAEFQRDRLTTLMAEYLATRMQWNRGVLSRGKRDIGYGWINHQQRARELRHWIEELSPGAGKTADDAGALITLLSLDLAGQPPEHIAAEDLTELRFSGSGFARLVRQQYLSENQDWELAMAAATPRGS